MRIMLLPLLLTLTLQAEPETVGTTLIMEGDVKVEKTLTHLNIPMSFEVERHFLINSEDRVVTGEDGTMTIGFFDDAELSLTEASVLELTRVHFDRVGRNEGYMHLTLIKGALSLKSGTIARLNAQSLTLAGHTLYSKEGTVFAMVDENSAVLLIDSGVHTLNKTPLTPHTKLHLTPNQPPQIAPCDEACFEQFSSEVGLLH